MYMVTEPSLVIYSLETSVGLIEYLGNSLDLNFMWYSMYDVSIFFV